MTNPFASSFFSPVVEENGRNCQDKRDGTKNEKGNDVGPDILLRIKVDTNAYSFGNEAWEGDVEYKADCLWDELIGFEYAEDTTQTSDYNCSEHLQKSIEYRKIGPGHEFIGEIDVKQALLFENELSRLVD